MSESTRREESRFDPVMDDESETNGSSVSLNELDDPTVASHHSRGHWLLSGKRSTGLWLNMLSWLALLTFVVWTVGPGLVGSKAFLGTDLLATFAPWASVAPVDSVTNTGVGDTFDSVAPTSIMISDNAADGNFALWDPYNAGGTEALATPNTGMLSPLSWPWWVLSHELAPAWVKLSEIVTVALGMVLLLQVRWRLPAFTAPLATLVFVSSGFLIAWTNWPQTRVAAFIPLMFWATDRLAVGKRWIDVVPLGLVLASMILSGFPAVTAYTIYAAFGFFLCRSIAVRHGAKHVVMGLLRSAVGVALGLALSAVQLLPFVWQSSHNIDFEARSFGESFPASLLTTTVVPSMLGLPDSSGDIWPVHMIEGFSYIGAASVIMVVAAMLIRPKHGHVAGVLPFFASALVFVGAAVYLGGLPNDLLNLLPAISQSPLGRIRSVLGFFVAVLVALGAAAIFEPMGLRAQLSRIRQRPRTRVTVALVYALLAGTVLAVIAYQVAVVYMSGGIFNAGNLSLVKRDMALALAIIGVLGTVVLVAWMTARRWYSTIAAATAIVTTLVPAILVAQAWWPLSDTETFYPETPTTEYLEQNVGQDRYITVGRAMSPAVSSAYQVRALSGHTFATPEWRELMESAVPGFYWTQTYSSLASESWQQAVQNPVLDRYAVRYIVAAPNDTILGEVDAFAPAADQVVLSEDSGALRTDVFSGSLRGVQLHVLQQSGLPEDAGVLELRVVSESGEELASGSLALEGIAADETIPISGEHISDSTSWHVELRFSDSAAQITLAAGGDGTVSVAPIRPADDGLVMVHSGDATIYERTTALSRIRWASSEEVVSDSNENLAVLNSSEDLDDTVILEHDVDARGVDGTSTADVTSDDVDTDNIEIQVKSSGAGWVVIEDAMRDRGWSALLDGEPVELVDADHAAVAVYVGEAGEHTITLSYSPPYFNIGLVITSAASLICVAAIAAVGVGGVRRRTRYRRLPRGS